MTDSVYIYDTTLRDGAQAGGVAFSGTDKLRIVAKLDALGVAYIEGGWPGSNPKDAEFFRKIRRLKLKNAKIAAFGSTKKPNIRPEDDINLQALIDSEAPVVTIVGKANVLHVKNVLKVSKAENLAMIAESCKFLAKQKRTVSFDAEHFFDGMARDKNYAIACIKAAASNGAKIITLCDTNGGSLPEDIYSATAEVKKILGSDITLGIHCHNDSDLAAANSLAALKAGAQLVQGTVNGFGERCGNANLCSIIPLLELKLNIRALPEGHLKLLSELSRYVSEAANVNSNPNMPFVGTSAFAHKGGMHADAVKKDPATFEHIQPEAVGNRRKILISELSGKSNLEIKLAELGMKTEESTIGSALKTIKQRENFGYEYEFAEASFALMVKRSDKSYTAPFKLISYSVSIDTKSIRDRLSMATVKVKVGKQTNLVAAESHSGPVNALDSALRKALLPFYPELGKMTLRDYKVRIISGDDGTAAKTRVLIESSAGKLSWVTVGVSENIINASCEALLDSVEYALLNKKGKNK